MNEAETRAKTQKNGETDHSVSPRRLPGYFRAASGPFVTVDFPTMPDAHDPYRFRFVIDFIQDTVISDSDSPVIPRSR